MTLKRLIFLACTLVCASPTHAQTGALLPWVNFQYTDNNGRPLSLGKICTYAAGTNNPVRTYTDGSLTVQNSEPVILDISGRAAIWIGSQSYKIVIQQPGNNFCPGTGAIIRTIDNVHDTGELIMAVNGSYLVGFEPTSGNIPTTVGAALNSAFLYDIGYSSLADACQIAQSNNKTLGLTKDWSGLTTQALECNIHAFTGGKLRPSSAQIVTIDGSFSGDLTQHFDMSNGGTVAPFKTPVWYPEWWGVTASATSLDTSATMAHMAASKAIVRGAHISFTASPEKKYWFSNITLGGNTVLDCPNGGSLSLPDSFGNDDKLFNSDITGTATSNYNLGLGCTFDGNRVNFAGSVGVDDNYAFDMVGTSNVIFHGVYVNWHTDAIIINGSNPSLAVPGDHIVFASDFSAKNSRRNNLSITCATNVFFDGAQFDGGGATVGGQAGTAPFANIDIEPNNNCPWGNISGSVRITNAVEQGFQVANQFANLPNVALHITCAPCSGNGKNGVLVTPFSSGTTFGGVTVDGILFGNGTAGGGNAGINIGGGVDHVQINANDVEPNAGTVAVSIGATHVSLAGGPYCGQALDGFLLGASAPSFSMGSEVKGCTGNTGQFRWNPAGATPQPLGNGYISSGTKFTTTGCSVSSTTGGATAGTFTIGAKSCSVIITINGATGLTAPNGWACSASDTTDPTILISQTASSTTTATLSIPAGAGATDVVSVKCDGY